MCSTVVGYGIRGRGLDVNASRGIGEGVLSKEEGRSFSAASEYATRHGQRWRDTIHD